MAKISPKLEKILLKLPESKVNDRNIVHELEQSFLDYSMSVITSRALPDLRDGLKPVHRRIVFSAHEEKLTNDKKFKKSAALVGTVMGSYHPHGDSSIYDALTRLSQDFNMRYPIIEGQGNFGSIDGDSPAAMRYTEVRLSKFGEFFLEGINEDTVDFTPNYDGSKEEPVILPTILPNLLLNGCTGIAVGLATKIPPHNISELCFLLLAYIDNPDLTADEVLSHLSGPDFPTGGEILDYAGVKSYIATGRGGFVLRAKVEIEEESNKNLLIIKEIPYGIKKLSLIKKIVSLLKPSKNVKPIDMLVNGITNITDESNLDGMRLIIECKKDIDPQVILNHLYKRTMLQYRFSVNLTVLINQQPKVVNIFEILQLYLEHQVEMLIRRTEFNLRKIKDRIHILEGRKTVADHLLEVIQIISNHSQPELEISKKYNLSEIQVKDIFMLPLKSIRRIEQEKVSIDLKNCNNTKSDYEETLLLPSKQLEIIKTKIHELLSKFGDNRKTLINSQKSGKIEFEDLVIAQKVVIILTKKGYLSQTPLEEFVLRKRGGVGVKGSDIYKDDHAQMLISCYSLDDIFLFTNLGKVYRLKAYELNLNINRTNKGQNIINLLPSLAKDETIITVLAVDREDYEKEIFLFFTTKFGVIKKTHISAFKFIRSNGKKATTLRGEDELKFVIKTTNESDILIASSSGKVVRFLASDARVLSRGAAGSRGITLEEKDHVISATSTYEGRHIFSIAERGIGKITNVEDFRLTRKGAKGVLAQKITVKTGLLFACVAVTQDNEFLLMTSKNKINRFKISDVSKTSRCTSGVILFKLDGPSEKLVYFAKNTISLEDENLVTEFEESSEEI